MGLKTITRLKAVEIIGENACIGQSEIFEATQIQNINLILISTDQLGDEIRQKLPCAPDIKVEKRYPSTVAVTIKSSPPVVQIADTQFSLNSDGQPTKAQNAGILPTLFLPQDIKIEETKRVEDKKVLFALGLVRELSKSDFTPTQVRFVDEIDIIIYSQTEAKAVFTTTKDVKEQVDSLQSVLAKAKIDASKISQIDLRFNKPVITYNQ